ncbi:unnamed protein product [Didymodactylos carnosus]|uniref:RFX-type winged-helix domain-containing protein n=1 Tax=Didymodactylos carnosus TaxID=1234261 RepID=A0A8S2I5D5_9BILA|nr:unnamed protein product [Didymodactylos carnosus]CAF3715059.1 unnamed protein product [Didymodactylos carnosus]
MSSQVTEKHNASLQSTKSVQPRQGSISHQTSTGNSQYLITTSTSSGTSTDHPQTSGQPGRVIIATSQATNSKSLQPSTSNVCTNGNGFQNGAPVQFQFNTNDGTLYTGTNLFFNPQQNTNSGDGYSHHILSCESGNGAFSFLQDGNLAQTLAHTTRASPSTVQWLVDNFEPSEGCSLRRSVLYSFYSQHCHELKLEQVNPASFGKLIRSVFLGLRTRRLGTRGNSKYHYYGIRLKASSSLNQYTDKNGGLTFKGQYYFGSTNTKKHSSASQPNANADNSPASSPTHFGELQDQSYSSESNTKLNIQQSQSTSDTNSLVLYESIQIDSSLVLPECLTLANLRRFEDSYKEHCAKLFDVITNFQFTSIEQIWTNFWKSGQSEQGGDQVLTAYQLLSVCSLSQVQDFIRQCDYILYQQLIERLIPDILSPMPGPITQSIRTFAKSLDSTLKSVISHMPETLKTIKLTIVSSFSMTLRRYTSLNHLAQAAKAVLQNSQQVQQMLQDLNKVDFKHIQEQASWVCECDDLIVSRVENDFKQQLQSQATLEQWAQWLDGVVTDILKPYQTQSHLTYAKMAKQFLLNWSFYCSMVIRDLTLRSAASFGSFHLIRLLYDEYMFYLIEHKIAVYSQKAPIAIMTETNLALKLSVYDSVIQPSSSQTILNDSAVNGAGTVLERRNFISKVALVIKKSSTTLDGQQNGNNDQHQAKIVQITTENLQLPLFNKVFKKPSSISLVSKSVDDQSSSMLSLSRSILHENDNESLFGDSQEQLQTKKLKT